MLNKRRASRATMSLPPRRAAMPQPQPVVAQNTRICCIDKKIVLQISISVRCGADRSREATFIKRDLSSDAIAIRACAVRGLRHRVTVLGTLSRLRHLSF